MSGEAEIIKRADFIEFANTQVEHMEDPQRTVSDIIVAAKALSTRIEDIEAGHLEVQPPLDAERLANYGRAATTAIAFGEKMVGGLGRTERADKANRQADAPKQKFTGTTDPPKANARS